MSIVLSRRNFLTSFAAGAALIAMPEPVRRYWQVPGNAPVGRIWNSVVVATTEMDDGTQMVVEFVARAKVQLLPGYYMDLPEGWALGA